MEKKKKCITQKSRQCRDTVVFAIHPPHLLRNRRALIYGRKQDGPKEKRKKKSPRMVRGRCADGGSSGGLLSHCVSHSQHVLRFFCKIQLKQQQKKSFCFGSRIQKSCSCDAVDCFVYFDIFLSLLLQHARHFERQCQPCMRPSATSV